MKKTALLLLSLGALLAGCSSPRDRIASKLMDYGLERPQAICMADELSRDLSRSQLRELADVALAFDQDRREIGRMTVGDVVRHVNRISDPQIVSVVTRAGIGCTVLRGNLLGL